MNYLTFEEYAEMGGILDLTAFKRTIDRAVGVVKKATHGRVDSMEIVPRSVKMLCLELVEYFSNDFWSSKQVSSHSQSAGGVSESESFVIRSIEERAGEVDDLIKDYLSNEVDDNGTPLLYRGAMI